MGEKAKPKKRKPRRQWYEVREVVIYRVLAHDESEAETIITESPCRDKYCSGVTDRDAYLAH